MMGDAMITDRIIDGSNDTLTAQMETGLTDVLVTVRRRSDGFYLDWSDITFKASGWTTQSAGMTEVGTTGQYERLLALASVTNLAANDVYIVTINSDTSNLCPQVGEIKAGDWVTNIAAISELLALAGKNRRIKNVVHDSDRNLVSATICGYANASDATNDVNPTITITVTGTSLLGIQSGLLEVES
jgi:hypothetical protein